MPIRSRLIALSIGILLPVLVATAIGLAMLYREQERATKENLQQLTRALATVAERELAVIESTLRTLAASPLLHRGDLGAFYEFAHATVPSRERSIMLLDESGQQLINTRVPYGAPLPRSTAFAGAGSSRADKPVLSDVYMAPIGKEFSYAMRIPVEKDGKTLYYLAMGSYGSTFQKILDDQRLRPGWNAAILDRKGVLLARRLEPQKYVGKGATGETLAAIKEAAGGILETQRLDGVRSFTSFTRIPGTEWTFVVSMPQAELQATFIGAFQFTIIMTVLAAALALLLAFIASRSIVRSVSTLSGLATALGNGRAVAAPALSILEMRQVATEMEKASRQIRGAQQTLEARVREAVADTKKAQDAILQHQKLEALGRLAGGIAHDFNNLLQTINTSMEVAARASNVPTVTGVLETGKRATQNAAKLTRQLMAFGRSRVGEVVTVDFRDRLLQTRDLIANALRQDIGLELETAGNLWPVRVDVVQLELALLNAALNARDAMPKGGTLAISAINETVREGQLAGLPRGQYVRITLHDTGDGIPPEILPRVFEPFFTTKETGRGSGLGLAQIYGFAKQSGGIAAIESASGKGTALSILLPRADGGLVQQRMEEARPAAKPSRLYNVLFVEDDALVQQVVVPALRASGFNVIPATSASDALAAVAQDRIDIVFTDIVMPGGRDGFELAVELKKRFPGMPIILATGYTQELPHAPGLRLLLKPYKLDDVEALLLSELERTTP